MIHRIPVHIFAPLEPVISTPSPRLFIDPSAPPHHLLFSASTANKTRNDRKNPNHRILPKNPLAQPHITVP